MIQSQTKNRYVREKMARIAEILLSDANRELTSDRLLAEAHMSKASLIIDRLTGLDDPNKEDWQAVAELEIACNGKIRFEGSLSQKNQRITGAYSSYYLSDQNIYKWAGMASYASDLVGFGIKVSEVYGQLPEDIRNAAGGLSNFQNQVQSLLVEGNNAVFRDIYWQHIAYSSGGIEEIECLALKGAIRGQALEGWRLIDIGIQTHQDELIWKGNANLLGFEQSFTLQPIYARHYKVATVLSPIMYFHLPGNVTFFQAAVPAGNIGNWKDRWKWIEETMLPNYRQSEATETANIANDLKDFKSRSDNLCN